MLSWPDPPQESLREAWVYLDGRPLFRITADAAMLGNRRREVQGALNEAAAALFEQPNEPIRFEIRQRSAGPILYLNDRYLMTVLESDAQLERLSPEAWAESKGERLRAALEQGRRERRPIHQAQAQRQAIALAAATFGATVAIEGMRRWLQWRDRRPQAPPPGSTVIDTQLRALRRKNWRALRDLLLTLTPPTLWLVTGLTIAGWFPQTRVIQTWGTQNLNLYLGLGAIALGTYAVIRLSFVATDRFVGAVLVGTQLSTRPPARLQQRVFTISSLVKSIVTVALAIAGVLVALVFLGVDIGPLIAGASLIGVALSLASQSLIKDAINGCLILLEDQYAVGDVIVVKADEIYGQVENITLRVTQLRDPEQRLITIPNSEIRIVSNLSSYRSQADLKIPIAYGSDLEAAIAEIEAVNNTLLIDPAWRPLILSEPKILGVDEFADTGLIVRVWIETLPLKQWDVAREFRRRLKLAFDRAAIAMATTQMAVAMTGMNRGDRRDRLNPDPWAGDPASELPPASY
ncbi:MAG: hypothetical protein Fur0042_08090 [Cyanophyceae cyanobacterium]